MCDQLKYLEIQFKRIGTELYCQGYTLPIMDGDLDKGLTWFFRLRGSYQGNPFGLLSEELYNQGATGLEDFFVEIEEFKDMWDRLHG